MTLYPGEMPAANNPSRLEHPAFTGIPHPDAPRFADIKDFNDRSQRIIDEDRRVRAWVERERQQKL